MLRAIGMIETNGLTAAIECSDVMTKSSSVELLDKIHIGGGLVTIVVRGDVGSVQAAIDAATASIKNLNESALVSAHVIPNPHDDIKQVFDFEKSKQRVLSEEAAAEVPPMEEGPEKGTDAEPLKEEAAESLEKPMKKETNTPEKINKAFIDKTAYSSGRKGAEEVLKGLKINDLRRLIREYETLNISNKEAMKLSRKTLINKILNFYI